VKNKNIYSSSIELINLINPLLADKNR